MYLNILEFVAIFMLLWVHTIGKEQGISTEIKEEVHETKLQGWQQSRNDSTTWKQKKMEYHSYDEFFPDTSYENYLEILWKQKQMLEKSVGREK